MPKKHYCDAIKKSLIFTHRSNGRNLSMRILLRWNTTFLSRARKLEHNIACYAMLIHDEMLDVVSWDSRQEIVSLQPDVYAKGRRWSGQLPSVCHTVHFVHTTDYLKQESCFKSVSSRVQTFYQIPKLNIIENAFTLFYQTENNIYCPNNWKRETKLNRTAIVLDAGMMAVNP